MIVSLKVQPFESMMENGANRWSAIGDRRSIRTEINPFGFENGILFGFQPLGLIVILLHNQPSTIIIFNTFEGEKKKSPNGDKNNADSTLSRAFVWDFTTIEMCIWCCCCCCFFAIIVFSLSVSFEFQFQIATAHGVYGILKSCWPHGVTCWSFCYYYYTIYWPNHSLSCLFAIDHAVDGIEYIKRGKKYVRLQFNFFTIVGWR